MKLRFLGTGTSFGIPVIGCRCPTCTSSDPRDRRTRHGALLIDGDRRVLVDTPPELRLQLLDADVSSIDAVWLTHTHADHVHGIDDLRAFSVRSGEPIAVHAPAEAVETLAARFDYIFDPEQLPLEGTTRPEAHLVPLHGYRPVTVGGFEMLPLPVPHGTMQVLGFRVGDLGYITDAKVLPSRTRDALRGVRTLVLNALWYGSPHPAHFNVEEALEVARDIGAEHTYLTHLTHRLLHSDLEARLPEGVHASYDGLEVAV